LEEVVSLYHACLGGRQIRSDENYCGVHQMMCNCRELLVLVDTQTHVDKPLRKNVFIVVIMSESENHLEPEDLGDAKIEVDVP